jgi:hypothetical protein
MEWHPARLTLHGAALMRLAWLAVAAFAANALAYTLLAANPLVQSDGWYAVDEVVRKAAAGHFQWQDLFVKRSALDHSQPLQKALMLLHYRLLGLDFSVEGLVGTLAAFAGLVLLWRIARDADGGAPAGRWDAARAWTFAAICAAYLSLNTPVVFAWPLLTLAYAGYVFVLLVVVAAWRALQAPGPAALFRLFAAALAMGVVADDSAWLVSVAIAIALLLQGSKSGSWKAPLCACAWLFAGMAAYRAVYLLFGPVPFDGRTHPDLLSAARGLAAQLHGSGAWQLVQAPFAMSLLHRQHLQVAGPTAAAMLEAIIAIALLAAHGWFWWQAWRGRDNAARFAATCLMLAFYGLVAGILVGRASMLGIDYLWQPRYSLAYQWNLVALLLMGLAGAAPARGGARVPAAAVPAAVALVLLLLQVPLDIDAWSRLRYSREYQQRMALQIQRLAEHPERPLPGCLPQLVACRMPLEQRRRVLGFLRQERLNVFSPAFQARHGLSPGPAD